MNDNHTVERIDQATNILLVAIIVIPFLLSFGALKDLAAKQHIAYAWLYPLMVDGSLLVFKFLVLRGSLHGQTDRYAWSMAIVATVISVALNVIHIPLDAPNLALARFMAGLPPLFILAAFAAVARRIEGNAQIVNWQALIKKAEAAARQWQSDAERVGEQAKQLKKSQEALQTENNRLQESNGELQTQNESLQGENGRLQKRLARLQAQLDEAQTPLKAWAKLNKEVQTLALVLAKEISPQQATDIIGVKDVRTVQNRANKLNGAGKGVAP